MANTNKDNIQKEKDREKNLSYLRNRREEVFHLDKELAFLRDEQRKRLLIAHLEKCFIVELDVPFTEGFAVERVKVDKDRKGFTMTGPQGEVWFELESCWKLAEPLEIPVNSPFPEIVIDQEGLFSIFQEMDELTIECPLSYVGEIQLKAGETGLLHFGRLHKFRCYPVSADTVIERVTPVDNQENEDVSSFLNGESGLDDYDEFDEDFDEDFDDFEMEFDRLHLKWTMGGMCFECDAADISFSFSDRPSIWSDETDDFLYTTLIDLDIFERDDIREKVDYFRTYESESDMEVVHQELAAFLRNPDWNAVLKWCYDGTFTTVELRRILESILRHSTEYLDELGLD